MARLAASMNLMTCFSIEISKNYKDKEFHEDIKNLLRTAGQDEQQIIFLFSDN